MHRVIADADNGNDVWYELLSAFEAEYGRHPPDDQLIAVIYEYAAWCLHHRSIDVRTWVVVSFYEHLPDNPAVSADMARWVSQEDFDWLEFAWEYSLKDKAKVDAFKRYFAERKAYFQLPIRKREVDYRWPNARQKNKRPVE